MDQNMKKEIGQRLFKKRKERKMTRAELGNIVNLHETTVKRYEDGIIKSLDIEKIIEFAKALDTTASLLLGWGDAHTMDLTDMEVNVIHSYRDNPDKQHAVNKYLGIWDNPPEYEDDPTIELQKIAFWDKYYSIDERGRKMVDMVLEQEFEHSKIEAPNLEYPDFESRNTTLKVAQESVEYTKE